MLDDKTPSPLAFPTVPNGYGKSALLETSQFQNAIAHFELLRRTPPSVVLISPFHPQNKKPT